MSARFSQNSSVEYIGDSRDPDILYYNATIVNNTTDDTKNGQATIDPPIRFNETRDTALIRDASRYQFSIVRFVVNGGNKDLPLFIPQIQSGTGQTDPNLTEYGVGITANLSQIGTTPTNWSCAPPLTYVEYISETQNPILAPVPLPPSSPNYIGVFNSATTYQPGQIVYSEDPARPFYYSYNSPIFTNGLPRILLNPPVSPTPPTSNNLYWTITSSELGRPQNLSTKYYWVYTYDWWLTLVNTALDNANLAIYQTYSGVIPGNPAPAGATAYATFDDWKAVYPSPVMIYDPVSLLFSIITPAMYNQTPIVGRPKFQIYFNVNMEGLFSNFPNNYYNDGVGIPWAYAPPATVALPDGYANAVLVYPVGGILGLNVITTASLPVPPTTYTGNWLKMTQNFLSTSTLWSPIDSIVFTSSLLPVQNEASAPPNVLGAKNIGNSAATSASAFTPTITDVAFDLSSDPSAYRKMIYYAPTAEYRMSDFQNSKFDIRNVDISVFWRNRLDNQLYPVSMFNLSSVSIKLMFRKKLVLSKSERNGQV